MNLIKTNIKFLLAVLIMLFLYSLATAKKHTLKIVTGREIVDYKDFVIDMRLEEYQKYPYLYKGSREEEIEYFNWFVEQQSSALVILFKGEELRGFLTGTALVDQDAHFQGSIVAFKKAGLTPEDYYYFADVIIRPQSRGSGWSKQLFWCLEDWARNQGFTKTCFVTESHDQHLLKPNNYWPLERLWDQLKYIQANFFVPFTWPTIQADNSVKNQEHQLDFWLKDLT